MFAFVSGTKYPMIIGKVFTQLSFLILLILIFLNLLIAEFITGKEYMNFGSAHIVCGLILYTAVEFGSFFWRLFI